MKEGQTFRDQEAIRRWLESVHLDELEPVGRWAAYRERWRNAPIHHAMIAIILVGCVLPWAIIIGGLLVLAVWDKIVGS